MFRYSDLLYMIVLFARVLPLDKKPYPNKTAPKIAEYKKEENNYEVFRQIIEDKKVEFVPHLSNI